MILLDPLAQPVIGHRGNRARTPENSIESFASAVAAGVDAIELDVRVSRDGVLMVIHDVRVDRTTNGSGLVSQLTVDELRALDAGANFTPDSGRSYPFRGRSIRIPTFDELVEAMPRDLAMIVELKTVAATTPLLEAIRRHDLWSRVIVAGFDEETTRPLRNLGIALGACTPQVASLLLPSLARRRIARLPYQALCIPPTYKGVPLPIKSMARAVRSSGTVMHLWTINDPRDARKFWDAGVQGIISDDPVLMLKTREPPG